MLSPLIKDINKGIEEYQAAEKELGDKWVLKVYDLEDDTTITLSTDFSEKHHPEIYKNVVVWEDLRNGNYDIYLYNLDTKEEKQITTNEKHQKNPQIFNDKIVWQDCRNSQTIGDTCKEADIYMYDLSSDSEIAVSSTKGNQMSPKIYGNYVLWSNHLSNSLLAAGSLHLELPLEIYDIAQGKISRVELPEDMVKAYSPEIYQNKIVYYAKNDSLLSDYRMFLYDIDEKTTEEFQFDGGFWGGGKIFEDNYVLVERSENWREEKKLTISLLDLNTKQKEELLEIEYTPSIDIFEDKIIYLTKIKGTTYKIHIYDSNQKKDIKIIDEFTDFYGPGFYDNKIAYISRES